jgi:hypothetical protein
MAVGKLGIHATRRRPVRYWLTGCPSLKPAPPALFKSAIITTVVGIHDCFLHYKIQYGATSIRIEVFAYRLLCNYIL